MALSMPRAICLTGVLLFVATSLACGGGGSSSGGSFANNTVPTNVVGQSDTSGISAGAALQAPGSGGASGATPTVTRTPTPAPSK